mmetsp:Transcript_5161/g.9825  ORF Transcript_5161/g.9825 Transcript_5161/m.9825 type:complete len:304 (+) Transcript_5161:120-1031(+)
MSVELADEAGGCNEKHCDFPEDINAAVGLTRRRTLKLKKEAEKKGPHNLPLLYGDIHNTDEDEMRSSLKARKVNPKTEGEKMVGAELRQHAPTREELIGTFHVNPESGYAVKSFTITLKDVFTASEVDEYLTDEIKAPPGHCLGGAVKLYALLRKENVVFNRGCYPGIMKCILPRIVYILTVSVEGIVRFHVIPTMWTFTKLMLVLGDSRRCGTCCSNLSHAMKNGCFCLGVMFEVVKKSAEQVEEGEKKESKKTMALVRYNRWAGDMSDLDIYWAAVQDGNHWSSKTRRQVEAKDESHKVEA